MQKVKKSKYKIKDSDFVVKSKAQGQMMEADFDNINEVLLTGPGSTGKSISLIISSMGPQKDGSFLVDNPNYVGLILRREATQLEKTGLIRNALEWYRKFYPTLEYNGSLKRVTFPSGSIINFGGCESSQDALKYKGASKLHFLGLEEGTQFDQYQIDILTTRLRDAADVIPLRVRISTNSGENEEPLLNRYGYWLYQSCIEPMSPTIKAKYGQVLYRYIDADRADYPLVVTDKKPDRVHESFVCIETKLNDIIKDNDQQMGKITDPVLREQLMNHKWGLKSGAGMYFQEIDFKEVTQKVSQATRIRYWDKACSGEKGDFLAGILMARTWDDKYIIEDIILKKVQVHEVKNIIKETAIKDGKTVYIGIEQEGGSSGKETSFDYEQLLRGLGFNLLIDIKTANKATSSKISRAALFSPIVKEGRVGILSGLDKNEFLKQMINFPSKYHDDGVDATCSAYLLLKDKLPTAMVNTQWNSMQRDFNRATNQYFPYDRTI